MNKIKMKIQVIDAKRTIRIIDLLTKKIEKVIQKYEKLLKLQKSVKKDV
jgi:hypothetical protein